jgi:hypothetical protein
MNETMDMVRQRTNGLRIDEVSDEDDSSEDGRPRRYSSAVEHKLKHD